MPLKLNPAEYIEASALEFACSLGHVCNGGAENNVGGLGVSILTCFALGHSNCRSFHQIIIHEEGAIACGKLAQSGKRQKTFSFVENCESNQADDK